MTIAYSATAYAGRGNKPSSCIAQGYQLTGPYTCTVTDPTGTGRSVSFSPSGVAKWYRTFLAPSSGNDGTEEKPYSLLTHITGQLGGWWAWSITDTGYVKLVYHAGAGSNGSITWGSSATPIAFLLGFANASGAVVNIPSTAPGGIIYAPYQPTGLAYFVARHEATGWRSRGAAVSASLAENGRVRGRTDRHRLYTQSFTGRLHPRTIEEIVEHGSHATPLLPPDQLVTRAHQPSGPLSVAPPWSLDEFFATCVDRRLGLALGNFQALVAGTQTRYEVGYFLPNTLRMPDTAQNKTDPQWKAFYDVQGIGLSRVDGSGTDGTETR